MTHPIFSVNDKVKDLATGEQGEIIAVDYEESIGEHIYLVRFADGNEESFADVALKRVNK